MSVWRPILRMQPRLPRPDGKYSTPRRLRSCRSRYAGSPTFRRSPFSPEASSAVAPHRQYRSRPLRLARVVAAATLSNLMSADIAGLFFSMH